MEQELYAVEYRYNMQTAQKDYTLRFNAVEEWCEIPKNKVVVPLFWWQLKRDSPIVIGSSNWKFWDVLTTALRKL